MRPSKLMRAGRLAIFSAVMLAPLGLVRMK
jgi:hypothetical protein